MLPYVAKRGSYMHYLLYDMLVCNKSQYDVIRSIIKLLMKVVFNESTSLWVQSRYYYHASDEVGVTFAWLYELHRYQ
jgi:hypothetical protein